MRKPVLAIKTAVSVAVIMGCLGLMTPLVASADDVADGKKIAFHKKKGNCLACHAIAGGKLAGNIGPPLVAMKARYPDKSKLYDQIFDARTKNPNTFMPPFGAHEIISKEDVRKVTEFIRAGCQRG